jgi:protein Xni
MHLLIIDAMNLIRRMYAAMPDHDNKEEACMNRCINTIADNAKRLGASHCAIIFERKEPTWRHAVWPDYKLGRGPMPEALDKALEKFIAGFKTAGFYCFEFKHWEADDVIASLAVKSAYNGLSSTIISTDKGFFQLVDSRIQILNHFDRQLFNEEEVRARYSVEAGQLVDLLALTGDTTNHLPGIKGIGIKTATDLLTQHQDLDTLLIELPGLDLKPKLKEALETQWRNALLTRKLARLVTDLPLGINLNDMRLKA